MCISALLGLSAASVSAGAAVVGTGVSLAGTIMSKQAADKQADAQERQMQLDADRHRRAAYRDMIRSQAMTEVAGASSGAMGGSGVMGGLSQAANSGLQSQRDTNQNQQLGEAQFSAQRQASTGQMLSGIGSGISSLGSAVVKAQAPLKRIGQVSASGQRNIWGWDNYT